METKKDEKRQTGYIYKIVAICEDFDQKHQYFGSTMNAMRKRMSKHKSDYKRWLSGLGGKCQSYELFSKYSIENCKMLLVSTVENTTRAELTAKEYEYILNNECINKVGKTGIMAKNRLEYKQEYYKVHKEAVRQQSKLYYEVNKEAISEKGKIYRQSYQQTINKRKSVKHDCECGGKYTQSNKAIHEKTSIHQIFITGSAK